ncbi:MAG: phage antirepressor N-terminal domain-containing protein [Sulfurimicrobium sp.]|nr:phage antirepressor N-terminal domain-containing protein [Sulfurimicrobium sp.]MDZ7656287.1 phage antirepressor N-terminal domain-containing protein [Sulfurimicrobium sp.]
MADTLIPVPFMGASLALIDHQGEPYAAMKPITEAMGLTWDSQSAKIKERFGAVASKIKATGTDGKSYSMVCLPLRKLPAWLATIQPNKTKPELRDRIRAYQAECDDALWAYWTQGKAERAPTARPPAPAVLKEDTFGILNKGAIEESDWKLTAAQCYASQAARLTAILIDQVGNTAKASAAAILHAAHASALNTLDLIEIAQNEVRNHA